MKKGTYERTQEIREKQKISRRRTVGFIKCKECGKEIRLKLSDLKWKPNIKYCSVYCYNKNKMGSGNPKWRGGRRITKKGYVYKYCPEHPRAKANQVYEHILVMEKHIGRYLVKGEVVHHINEVKDDNRIENLLLMTRIEHARMHGLKNYKDGKLKNLNNKLYYAKLHHN